MDQELAEEITDLSPAPFKEAGVWRTYLQYCASISRVSGWVYTHEQSDDKPHLQYTLRVTSVSVRSCHLFIAMVHPSPRRRQLTSTTKRSTPTNCDNIRSRSTDSFPEGNRNDVTIIWAMYVPVQCVAFHVGEIRHHTFSAPALIHSSAFSEVIPPPICRAPERR